MENPSAPSIALLWNRLPISVSEQEGERREFRILLRHGRWNGFQEIIPYPVQGIYLHAVKNIYRQGIAELGSISKTCESVAEAGMVR